MREIPKHRRPPHLELLADALDLNYRGIEVDYLPLIDVVHECETWLRSSVDWAARWAQQPRKSLADELLLGLENLGPTVRSECDGAVEGTEAAVRDWKAASLEDVAEASVDLKARLEALRGTLVCPSGLGALWDDLVICHEQGLRNWRRRERVLDFVAVSTACGHAAPWFALSLVGLIRDETLAVRLARQDLAGRLDESTDVTHVSGTAGSTLTEMCELLAHTVRAPAPFGEVVVWLEFHDADLGEASYVDAGDVELWNARHLFELLGESDAELPPQMEEICVGDDRFVVLPESEEDHRVWARVVLGQRVATGAEEDGFAVVMMLADLAAVRVGGPRWARGEWVHVLLDGRTQTSGGSKRRDALPPFPDHIRGVGDQLASIAATASWTAPRADLGRIARLWAQVEYHEEPEDRVPAVIRFIEALLDKGVNNSSLTSTVPKARAWNQQSHGFSNPVSGAIQDLAVSEGRYRAAPEMFAEALPEWPRVMNYNFPPLLATLEQELANRSQRFAIDVRNSRVLVDDWAAQRDDFDATVGRHLIAWARVLRYRNAVTHGSPAPPATGAVALRTADAVGLAIMEAALAAAHSNRDVTGELQRSAWWALVPGWARKP